MKWLDRWRQTGTHRAEFYELLGGFVADGIPLFNALTEIDTQYQRHAHPMRHVTQEAILRLRGQGKGVYSFGMALRGMVPANEVLTILGGEESGQTALGLGRAGQLCREGSAIVGALREELGYPAFLVLLFAALLIGISAEVIPTLSSILPVERWPASARAIAGLAGAAPWLLALLALIGFGYVAAFLTLRESWTGPFRQWLDRSVFPWSTYRRISGAMLLSSLSALLRIGVPLSHALERLRDNGAAWEAGHIEYMRGQLRLGVPEGRALASDLFDTDMRWQIELYGRMTEFSLGLEKLSVRLVRLTRERIVKSAAVIRVVLLVLIAMTVVWLYSAFLSITMAARAVG